jgi:hypothetical protein
MVIHNIVVTSDNAESIALRWLEEQGHPNPNQAILDIKATSDIFCPWSTDVAAQEEMGSSSVEGFIDMLEEHLSIMPTLLLSLPDC